MNFGMEEPLRLRKRIHDAGTSLNSTRGSIGSKFGRLFHVLQSFKSIMDLTLLNPFESGQQINDRRVSVIALSSIKPFVVPRIHRNGFDGS